MVNFTCQPDGVMRCPDTWLALILGGSGQVFLEEIRSGGLGEADCPPQGGGWGGRLIQSFEGLSIRLELELPLSALLGRRRPRLELHHQLSGVFSLLTTDAETSQCL